MEKITMLGLGIFVTEEEENLIDDEYFSSPTSILDYTSVIISVGSIIYEYVKTPGTFQGLDLLDDDNKSAKLIRDMKRRKSEIEEMLKQGNNVFVILPYEQNIYIRTGRKEYSGTGRNRATTNIVDTFDLLSFLPVQIECTQAVGRKINYVGNGSFDIIKTNMMNDFQYRSYISKGEGTPLLQIVNTTKNVGMVIEYEKGKLILLPEFADEEIYEGDDDEWNKGIHRCINNLIQLDTELKQAVGEFELPEWTKGYLLPQEKNELAELDKCLEELSIIKSKIEKQRIIIKELQNLKLAFVATGQILENICKEMFIKLGFKELEVEKNRSDLVLKYGRRDVVVEIKGLNKSAGEKNAAQLEKWVCEHIEQYDKRPKAILLVNVFRNVSLDKRNEDAFPKQMIKYSTSREQCLISTTQFVGLYLECLSRPSKKKELIKKMLDTVGVYGGHNNVEEYIEVVEMVK